MDIRALYVHAPFCRRRCGYCDFAVTVASSADPADWARVVALELRDAIARERLAPPLRPRTLYVGGGTPSMLGAHAMDALAAALAPFVSFGSISEWTAEANPESFDREVAHGWAAAGVNRISLGAQTFDADALRWMGRLHGPEGPARALDAARHAGIDNVSLDLIFGLPARLNRDWEADLDTALSLGPAHLSLYGLTAEKGTPLRRRVDEGREALPPAEVYAEEYRLASRRLAEDGWEHYEVSNFCRPGRSSVHNEAYWDGSAYLGLGSGAHSFLAPRRWWNLRDWRAYRSAVESGRTPVDEEEILEAGERELERVWLGLRTRRGIAPRTPGQRNLARAWVSEGLAEWCRDGHAGPGAGRPALSRVRAPECDRFRLTPEGWLVLDRLALDYDGVAGSARAHGRAMARGVAE
ncbi:MAG TPA: radical SAM family heme chaperone HemW [Longimicrobiales bacterium]|nr:radical SAM family heme chaperone HemW [Longimicrobiales bacterium]